MFYNVTLYNINDIAKKRLLVTLNILSDSRSDAIDKAQTIAEKDFSKIRTFVEIRPLICSDL